MCLAQRHFGEKVRRPHALLFPVWVIFQPLMPHQPHVFLCLLTFSSASSLCASARADQNTALMPSFWK